MGTIYVLLLTMCDLFAPQLWQMSGRWYNWYVVYTRAFILNDPILLWGCQGRGEAGQGCYMFSLTGLFPDVDLLRWTMGNLMSNGCHHLRGGPKGSLDHLTAIAGGEIHKSPESD